MKSLFVGIAVSILILSSLPAYGAEIVQPTDQALDNVVEAVEFHNTPIVDILRLLARQNNLNLIIGPDSMGSVSLRFSGVTLRSALDVILRSKGFQYQIYDNIMLVNRPDSLEKVRGLGLETRIFRLKYTDARDVKMAIDTSKVLSPWGHTSIFSRAVATDAAKAQALRPVATESGSPTSVNVADPIQRGTLPLQSRSDVLLVTDRLANLEQIASLLDQMDKPSKQVAIDVKFVETVLTDDQQTGIDWQQLLAVQGAYKGKTQWLLGGQDQSGLGSGTVQFGALDATRFNVVLDLLLKNSKAKLLSQPRIASLDNQPATIGVGTTTWIEQRTGDLQTGSLQITYTERRVPIELVVVPHILEGGIVMLEMRPVVEEITGWQTGAGGLQLPLISSRTADTRIEVRDGETAVIGGLLKDKTIWTTSKVWFLGSLPLIGHLFQHEVQSVERTDLSIFITPRIVKDDQNSPFPLPAPDATNKDTTSKAASQPANPPTSGLADSKSYNDAGSSSPQAGATPTETVDMRDYFPLEIGAQWTYQWQEATGGRWISNMAIRDTIGSLAYALESIPDGAYKTEAHVGYKWSNAGLLNIFKCTPGKDSIAYSPERIIIPAKMELGKGYQSSYAWKDFDLTGKQTGSDQISQTQRLVKHDSVILSNARYTDCVLVETVWSDSNDKSAAKKRKLVWYAREVGPVKVEHDIPLQGGTNKGRMSALLAKR